MGEHDQQDEEIALLVQSGKVELFEILIQRYEIKLARYALRLLSNQEDVKDVLQEIFTKAYVNINSFDRKRKFSSWIYRIAHNEIVNVFLKNKRRKFVSFDLDVFLPHHIDNNTIGEEIERQEFKKIIADCFDQLEDKYKEPVALYYLEGFSYKEIADIMHIPVSTVGIRIKRAKGILKNIFKQKGYEYQR